MVQSRVETGDELHKKVDFPPVLSISINGSTILLVILTKKQRITFDGLFLLDQSASKSSHSIPMGQYFSTSIIVSLFLLP